MGAQYTEPESNGARCQLHKRITAFLKEERERLQMSSKYQVFQPHSCISFGVQADWHCRCGLSKVVLSMELKLQHSTHPRI